MSSNSWKVESLDIEQISPYDIPKVYAEISGFLDIDIKELSRYRVLNDFKEFIEKRLNTNSIEGWKKTQRVKNLDSRTVPGIKNVIFNDPLTIVIWSDGTKTFVKASENDEYDPEKGMALAIAKKTMGNKYSYYDEIRKWVAKDEERKKKAWLKLYENYQSVARKIWAQLPICEEIMNEAKRRVKNDYKEDEED